ncbi:hypothetical protein ACSS6W_009494 [Trichoderma asperelloides]
MADNAIEKILQYHFQDPALLKEVLHADGSTPTLSKDKPREHGNKALAMIGDAVLRLVVVNDGIVGGNTRQSCHEICMAETSNTALSKILRKWEMDRFVHLPGSLKGTVARTAGASTTEAIVAAVWIDSDHDFDTVHRVIHNLHIGVGCT